MKRLLATIGLMVGMLVPSWAAINPTNFNRGSFIVDPQAANPTNVIIVNLPFHGGAYDLPGNMIWWVGENILNSRQGYVPFLAGPTNFGNSPWNVLPAGVNWTTNKIAFNDTNYFIQRIPPLVIIGTNTVDTTIQFDIPSWTGTGTRALTDNGTYAVLGGGVGIINPTDNYIPYRFDALTFGDSPWNVVTTNKLGFYGTTSFLVYSNLSIGLGMNALVDNTGPQNVAIGDQALQLNTSGNGNVAIGNGAMYASDTSYNIGIGVNALNGGGSSDNIAIGHNAMVTTPTAYESVAIGVDALTTATQGYNVAVGNGSGAGVVSGSQNTFLGTAANGVADGSYNTIIGSSVGNVGATHESKRSVVIGSGNANTSTNLVNSVIVGTAGDGVSPHIETSSASLTNVIVIGYDIGITNNNEIVIGNSTNTKAIFPITTYTGTGTNFLSDDGTFKLPGGYWKVQDNLLQPSIPLPTDGLGVDVIEGTSDSHWHITGGTNNFLMEMFSYDGVGYQSDLTIRTMPRDTDLSLTGGPGGTYPLVKWYPCNLTGLTISPAYYWDWYGTSVDPNFSLWEIRNHGVLAFNLLTNSGYAGGGTKVLTDNGTYQTASTVITSVISGNLLWTNSPTGAGTKDAGSSNVIASLPTGLDGATLINSADVFAVGQNAGQNMVANQSTNLYSIGTLTSYASLMTNAQAIMNLGDLAGDSSIVVDSVDVNNIGLETGMNSIVTNGTFFVLNLGDTAGDSQVVDSSIDAINIGYAGGRAQKITNSTYISNIGDSLGMSLWATDAWDIFNYGFGSGNSIVAQRSTNLFSYGNLASQYAEFETVNDLYNYGAFAGSGTLPTTLTNALYLFNYGSFAGYDMTGTAVTNWFTFGDGAGRDSIVTNLNDFFAYGYGAGRSTVATNASALYSFGTDAGFDSVYDTGTSEIYNFGYLAGKRLALTNTIQVLNLGVAAGQTMTAQDSSSILNLGSYAGASSIYTNSSEIVNIGSYAGNLAKLTNSSRVYSYGYQSGRLLAGSGYSDIYLLGTAQPTRKTNEFSFGGVNDLYTFNGPRATLASVPLDATNQTGGGIEIGGAKSYSALLNSRTPATTNLVQGNGIKIFSANGSVRTNGLVLGDMGYIGGDRGDQVESGIARCGWSLMSLRNITTFTNGGWTPIVNHADEIDTPLITELGAEGFSVHGWSLQARQPTNGWLTGGHMMFSVRPYASRIGTNDYGDWGPWIQMHAPIYGRYWPHWDYDTYQARAPQTMLWFQSSGNLPNDGEIIRLDTAGGSGAGPIINFRLGETSPEAPTAATAGRIIGGTRFWVHDGTSYRQGAEIIARVASVPAAQNVPTQLEFRTGTNATDLATAMTVASNRFVGIGTTTPANMLSISQSSSSANYGLYPSIEMKNPNTTGVAWTGLNFISGTTYIGGLNGYVGSFYGYSTSNTRQSLRVETASTAYPIAMGAGNVTTLVISNSCVGVNNNNPIEAVDVTGNIKATGSIKAGSTAAATSTLQSVGSFAESIATGGTATLGSTNDIYLCNVDAQLITLPTAVGCQGRNYTVKLIAPATTGTVTNFTGAQLIDGALSYSLTASNKFVHVISDGANYWIVGNN